MPDTIPSQARVVIIGGGITGCSVAYHLTKLGWRDVVLLEQGRLTCGTTWHAAGLVGQMRPNRTMTEMSRYGIELYAGLERETGLATGWKQCGSVNVAASPERLIALKRRPHRRGVDPGRRQGQPDGLDAIPRQGRAHGRRQAHRRGESRWFCD
jgi:4-methylaminobutanoate oxidase (formaldehyde-forming)